MRSHYCPSDANPHLGCMKGSGTLPVPSAAFCALGSPDLIQDPESLICLSSLIVKPGLGHFYLRPSLPLPYCEDWPSPEAQESELWIGWKARIYASRAVLRSRYYQRSRTGQEFRVAGHQRRGSEVPRLKQTENSGRRLVRVLLFLTSSLGGQIRNLRVRGHKLEGHLSL